MPCLGLARDSPTNLLERARENSLSRCRAMVLYW